MADDMLLLSLIKRGDEHAFKHLFYLYFASLCRYTYLYLNREEEAEEITLDLFTHLWEHREEIEIKLSLKAYLFQAARNRCFNALRSRKQTVALEDASPEALLHQEHPSIEFEELGRLLQEAIHALPDRCREVFMKSRTEQLTNQEIAHRMGTSVKTVEAQITKALKRIREHLGEGYSYLF
jgi:RNA polymerase sigma-70 factor (ECF subfamily)